jgi:hypothetical protein
MIYLWFAAFFSFFSSSQGRFIMPEGPDSGKIVETHDAVKPSVDVRVSDEEQQQATNDAQWRVGDSNITQGLGGLPFGEGFRILQNRQRMRREAHQRELTRESDESLDRDWEDLNQTIASLDSHIRPRH